MHNPDSLLENEMHKLPWDFEIQTDHLISARRPDLVVINRKKRTCWIVDLTVPADPRVKLKENEKRDKYLNLAKELKKLWNMKVTVISIAIGALGSATKRLIQGLKDVEIRGCMETIQTITLLRLNRILRRVLETWGNLLSLKL